MKFCIIQELLSKADGSFRWIGCELESLADQDSVVQVRLALNSLPVSLDKHYRETLTKIPPKDRMRIRRLLPWLVVQYRQLIITELSEAVVLTAGSDGYESCRPGQRGRTDER